MNPFHNYDDETKRYYSPTGIAPNDLRYRVDMYTARERRRTHTPNTGRTNWTVPTDRGLEVPGVISSLRGRQLGIDVTAPSERVNWIAYGGYAKPMPAYDRMTFRNLRSLQTGRRWMRRVHPAPVLPPGEDVEVVNCYGCWAELPRHAASVRGLGHLGGCALYNGS